MILLRGGWGSGQGIIGQTTPSLGEEEGGSGRMHTPRGHATVGGTLENSRETIWQGLLRRETHTSPSRLFPLLVPGRCALMFLGGGVGGESAGRMARVIANTPTHYSPREDGALADSWAFAAALLLFPPLTK